MNERQRDVRRVLRQVRRRWWIGRALQVVVRVAVGLGVLVVGLLVVDRLFDPSDLLVLIALGIASVAGLAWTGWSVWPLTRSPDDRQVARFVEERCPELEDALVTAVALDGPEATGVFAARLLAEVTGRLRELDLDRVVSRQRLRREAMRSLVLAAVLAGLLAVVRDPVERGWRALQLYGFPTAVTIEVSPGDAKVLMGASVQIRARLRGIEQAGRVPVKLEYGAGAEWRREIMQPAGDHYEGVVSDVTQPLRYRVTAGHAVSSEYRIVPLSPPRVARIDLEYRYPPFTGLKPRVDTDSGDIYAPRGTRVTVRVHTSKPVASGLLALGGEARQPLTQKTDTLLEGELTVQADGSYRIALADRDGLATNGDTEYFIRMMDDRPPDVRILRPGRDRRITPLEEVVIEARADDDYGIARFELVYAVRGGRERVVPLGPAHQAPSVTANYTLAAEDLNLQPGDFVTYYARARDVGRGKRPTEARSDIFFLEVTPFSEAFAAATSQGVGAGGGGGLEDLAAAQKEIIVATWKLDRRSTGGRSDEDVRTLARAQGELRLRAQRAARATPLVRDPRGRTGLAPAPGPESDPMTLAVAAMGQAERALAHLETAAALPHEMEALNHLLRAAAEIDRRQVARQGGGGGGGRPRADLSALFDRELQRQQQTNYETPASEARREDEASEALARVRDLARRQDELAREQQELLARLAQADEATVKRELERLSREQAELSQQAQALARELARRGTEGRSGAASGQGSGGAGREEVERLRQASAAMKGAASELGRQQIGRAADYSRQAAARLQEAERRLRRAAPEERRRALGELQLEARQLADAGRRLADEARGSGDALRDGDRRRRLAGESERLADRVDRLAEELKTLAPATTGAERAAVDNAAAELARQQVGRRLREGAEALRRATSTAEAARRDASRVAERGQQAARALDRIAVELGALVGARDRETARIADDLARAAELAARLAEIERQLDALERRGSDRAQGTQPAAEGRRGADAPQEGGRAAGNRASGSGSEDDDRTRLWERYWSELGRARGLVDELRRERPELDALLPGSTGTAPTWSAPGTEAFKQDFARWEVLRREVRLALEHYQIARSNDLAERTLKDRLQAGASERLPEAYRRLVERYYQTLAARKKP